MYEKVYKPAVDAFGLPERIVVDRGTEFTLVKHGHKRLVAQLRPLQTRLAVKEVPSTQNNKIEVWRASTAADRVLVVKK